MSNQGEKIIYYKLKNDFITPINNGNNISLYKDDIIESYFISSNSNRYNIEETVLFIENIIRYNNGQLIECKKETYLNSAFINMNRHIFDDISKEINRENKIKEILEK